MTTEELQRVASLVRFAGIIVTAIGFAVTCVGHLVAERLLKSQQTDRAKAQKALAESQAELAAAKKNAADALALGENLEKAHGPRHLTKVQKDLLLKELSGGVKGEVYVVPNGPAFGSEPLNFALELMEVFKEAGIQVYGGESSDINSWGRPGQFIVVCDPANQPPHGGQIQRALVNAGIQLVAMAEPARFTSPSDPARLTKIPPSAIIIGIGSRN